LACRRETGLDAAVLYLALAVMLGLLVWRATQGGGGG
jgi:hypothetical protein